MKALLNKYLGQAEIFFTVQVNQPNTILLFKKAIYLHVFINGLILLPIATQIWSPDANLIHYHPDGFRIAFINCLSNPALNNYYLFFVIGQLVSCVIAVIGFAKRLMSTLIYFLSASLYFNAGVIQNGGTNLLLIILFYLIFANEDAEKHASEKRRLTDRTFTNFAFLAIQIQVCILYFVSAIYKLFGAHWMDGSALYYILNIDEYTAPWVQHYIANTDWLTIPVTYFTLFFQLAFPITVWIKKLKTVTVIIGIAFHVLIIFMMGLTDFGLIMLLIYILFLSDKKSDRILSKLKLSRK